MSPSMKNSKIKYSMKLVLLKSVSPHVDRRYFQDPENQAAEGRLRPSPDHGPDLLFKLQSGPLSTRGRGAVRSVVGWENVSMRSRSTSGPTGSPMSYIDRHLGIKRYFFIRDHLPGTQDETATSAIGSNATCLLCVF